MKLFTLVQGVAVFAAVALAINGHSLGLGITAFVIAQIGYGVPSITIFIIRRVKRYNRRVAGMEAYRAQVFMNQYGVSVPTAKAPASKAKSTYGQTKVYTLS